MSQNQSAEFLVFTLDTRRIAISLQAVERIVRAAEITPLPNAPSVVLGVLDVEGAILPVLSLRRRFRMPDRDIRVTDQFLLAATRQRTVVLVIDAAQGVVEVDADRITGATRVMPGLEHVAGVVALEDGLVLIHDLETFLSLEEAAALDHALSPEAPHGH